MRVRAGAKRKLTKKYEIYSGRRIVSTQESVSPLHAVVDYVRSYGVKDDEILRLGVDSVAWRGARFRAVPVDDAASSAAWLREINFPRLSAGSSQAGKARSAHS